VRTRSIAVFVAAILWAPTVAAAQDRVVSVPHDVATLEEAIAGARPGDLILLDRGTYRGGVVVPETVHDITIRGVDRNDVVFDGGDQEENAITVLGGDVALENMTAHHYTGNGFYWSGVDGFLGRYLTVYDVGLYGIYAIESRRGRLADSLVSGAADAAFYIGECNPCDAVLTGLTARLSAIGYSGTNASGVTVTDSVWERNGTGILPNSYDVGKAPPPEERSTFTDNVVRDSGRAPVPLNTPLAGFWGLGIGIAGGNHNTVAANVIEGSARYGIAVYPTIQEEATWVPEGNEVADNTVSGSGIADLALSDGSGPGNCFRGNGHASALPAGLDAAECGAGATGSTRVGADLAVPPPVAEEAAASAVPFFSNPPSYSEMPAPPPQRSLPDAAIADRSSGPDLLSILAAGAGLALVLAAALLGPLRRRRSVGVALMALGAVLVAGAWSGWRSERETGGAVEARAEPQASPTVRLVSGRARGLRPTEALRSETAERP